MKIRYSFLIALPLTFLSLCYGQSTTDVSIADNQTASSQAADSSSSPPGAPAAPALNPDSEPLLGRWLEIDNLSHSERYRNAFRTGGFHFFNNAQQRNLVSGRFKLDPKGHYFIGFRASSGHYFNWAYSDYFGGSYSVKRLNAAAVRATFTPAQFAERSLSKVLDPVGFAAIYATPSNGWEFYLRELYFSATPVDGFTVEFGSLGIERGVATEATTFDYDGYITGERIRIHDPEHLFFDQVGFTSAFFGDVNLPSVFARGDTFKEWNYYQGFADKKLNSRFAMSASYTWQLHTNAIREAVVVGTKESKAFDDVRLELYQRTNAVYLQGLRLNGGSGFALSFEKKVTRRLSGDFGFAAIDGNYTAFTGSRFMHSIGFSPNGDTIGQGNRPFIHATYKLNSIVTAQGYYTHAIGAMVNNVNQQGLTAGVIVDFKSIIDTRKKIF